MVKGLDEGGWNTETGNLEELWREVTAKASFAAENGDASLAHNSGFKCWVRGSHPTIYTQILQLLDPECNNSSERFLFSTIDLEVMGMVSWTHVI